MAKRRGDVVFLDEFVDEIGVDAARWYLLSRGHDQTIEIDVDLAAERSQKNPVYYVQYAHARIAGVLRNAGERSPEPQPAGCARGRGARPRQAAPRAARRSSARRRPGGLRTPIPTYAIRVADDFHRFYHHHRVLDSDEEPFRLALCAATQRRGRDVPRPGRGGGARPDVARVPELGAWTPRSRSRDALEARARSADAPRGASSPSSSRPSTSAPSRSRSGASRSPRARSRSARSSWRRPAAALRHAGDCRRSRFSAPCRARTGCSSSWP